MPVQQEIRSALITETPPTQLSSTMQVQSIVFTDTPIIPVANTTALVIPTNTQSPVTSGNLLCTENLIAESPWHLEATDDAAEDNYDFDDQYILKSKDILQVTYDLHGLMAQDGSGMNDSAIVFTQPFWYGISLANPKYGQNGLDGEQTVQISLRDFVELPNSYEGIEGGAPLDLNAPVSSIRARFWHAGHFMVDITSIQLCSYK